MLYLHVIYWAREASPTLGCSIEISRDIYMAYYTSKSGIWLVISRVYLFYTSYSYNSISRYVYRGISAHILRRDLVIFCVLRSH